MVPTGIPHISPMILKCGFYCFYISRTPSRMIWVLILGLRKDGGHLSDAEFQLAKVGSGGDDALPTAHGPGNWFIRCSKQDQKLESRYKGTPKFGV